METPNRAVAAVNRVDFYFPKPTYVFYISNAMGSDQFVATVYAIYAGVEEIVYTLHNAGDNFTYGYQELKMNRNVVDGAYSLRLTARTATNVVVETLIQVKVSTPREIALDGVTATGASRYQLDLFLPIKDDVLLLRMPAGATLENSIHFYILNNLLMLRRGTDLTTDAPMTIYRELECVQDSETVLLYFTIVPVLRSLAVAQTTSYRVFRGTVRNGTVLGAFNFSGSTSDNQLDSPVRVEHGMLVVNVDLRVDPYLDLDVVLISSREQAHHRTVVRIRLEAIDRCLVETMFYLVGDSNRVLIANQTSHESTVLLLDARSTQATLDGRSVRFPPYCKPSLETIDAVAIHRFPGSVLCETRSFSFKFGSIGDTDAQDLVRFAAEYSREDELSTFLFSNNHLTRVDTSKAGPPLTAGPPLAAGVGVYSRVRLGSIRCFRSSVNVVRVLIKSGSAPYETELDICPDLSVSPSIGVSLKAFALASTLTVVLHTKDSSISKVDLFSGFSPVCVEYIRENAQMLVLRKCMIDFREWWVWDFYEC